MGGVTYQHELIIVDVVIQEMADNILDVSSYSAGTDQTAVNG
jgi:hypothetical protein